MNKQDLTREIATKTGLTKKDAESFIEAFKETVQETLVAGDKVSLPGFLAFEVKETVERQGRNPQTGETITIPAGKKVSTKIGKGLKDAINS